MPVARYFFFVGAALLALLFAADVFLPTLPAAVRTASAIDAPVIRIHSDRKWPERIVFDTSKPTIVPVNSVAAAKTDALLPAAMAAADTSAKVRVRDAFAQLAPPEPKQIEPAAPKKPQPPLQHKRKVVRNRVAPPTILVAQQPRFGFFANNIW